MSGVERRQFVGLISDDGHAFGLQVLECEPEIQDRLGTGANDHDGCLRQFLEIGGDVECLLRASVHASDAAGSEDPYACHGGDDHGRRHGGSSVGLAGDKHGQVSPRRFGHREPFLTEVFDLLRRASGFQFASDDSDSGGHGSVLTDRLLHPERRLHVLRVRHAVRDDSGLQRHYRFAGLQRRLHFRRYGKIFIHS